MATYLVFSDEAGQYTDKPSQSFLSGKPYYVRSAVMLDIESWVSLKDQYFELKKAYELPVEKEIKWSYLWLLSWHQRYRKPIPPRKPYYFLRDYKLSDLHDFVTQSCDLLSGCSFCRVILTVTPNRSSNSWSKSSMYKFHLQELMQRIEMEIQHKPDNLAILFFDAIDEDVDKLLREAYNDLYFKGDFIEKYSHIKDSLSFELSHHSFGIQIADFTAGSFNSFMRGYEFGTEICRAHLYELLRRKPGTDEILGFGIREVPTDDQFRSQLESKLTSLLPIVD